MSHRIAISFAAAIIGMACIATDASARGGGGGGGGGGKGGGPVTGVTAIKSYGPASPSFKGAGPVTGVTAIKSYGSPSSTPPSSIQMGVGVPVPAGATAVGTTGATGGGTAAGARYYAPASYNSNVACGRYPYPPCKKVSPR
jgi:hypothetical protein